MNSKYIEILYEKILEQDIFIFYILLDIHYYRQNNEKFFTVNKNNDTAVSSTIWENMRVLFKSIKTVEETKSYEPNYYILWGLSPNINQQKILKKAYLENKDILIFEDGFLRSIHSFSKKNAAQEYREGISFTMDRRTAYYDCSKASDLEILLNNKDVTLTKYEVKRAKDCIKKIISNHLSKYNDQSIIKKLKNRNKKEIILIIDQSKGDLSVKMGGSNASTFQTMLNCAIEDNPLADILIKTHPDTIDGARDGYLTQSNVNQNIRVISSNINPISLINECDKVYVCTSQVGFEALMCKKEVHVFGIPFYAGWGLTHDYQKCERRKKSRSLEEIFYISYILYSHYIDPYKKEICQIEEAIEILLKQRNEYFNVRLSNKRIF